MAECCCPPRPDDPAEQQECPRSGTRGHTVDLTTVKALLTSTALARITGSPHRFCPEPTRELAAVRSSETVALLADEVSKRRGATVAGRAMDGVYLESVRRGRSVRSLVPIGEGTVANLHAGWRGATMAGRWKELVYVTGQRIMTAAVASGTTFRAGDPKALFDTPIARHPNENTLEYAVTADGQRFLAIVPDAGNTAVTVVLNWSEELKQRVPRR